MSIEAVVTGPSQRTRRQGFFFTPGQILLTILLLIFGLLLIISTVQIALFNTVLIFLFVLVSGLAFCHATSQKLNDPKLRLLGTFWLINLGMTLFLLYAGWIPQLDPHTSSAWGYDPQRYFQDAYKLIENGWDPEAGSNYQGIIFYYGAIFYLLGYNPVIPALINAFVTLLGTLYLMRLAFEFKGERGPRDWTLVYLLLIPEVIWYNVMTSRETLMAVLVIVSTLASGRYIVRSGGVLLTSTILLVGGSLGAILLVRTSMAIPVVVAIGIMVLFLRVKRGWRVLGKFLLMGLVIWLLLAGPLLQQEIQGINIDYVKTLRSIQSFEGNVAVDTEWRANSIGLLLSPRNLWEAIAYTPPRMVFYLAAPLPDINISVAQLRVGSYSAWQNLLTIPTSMLNLLAFPLVMAGFVFAWKRRFERPAPLVLYIAFWSTFIAIAGGNIIIHERYRLMMTLLLYSSAWLGYSTCSKTQISRFSYIWYGFLCSMAVFYLAYKFL